MFKNLLFSALISLSAGVNAVSSSSSIETKSIMNSTSYEFVFNSEITLDPHSEETNLNAASSYWEETYIYVYADSKPTDVYYWINQIDNEQEVLCSFYSVPIPRMYQFDLPNLSGDTIRGIQFFQKKSIVGETYYLLNGDLSNFANFNSGNLIEDKTATIGNHGITSLVYSRTHVDKGLIGFCQYTVNGVGDIANNSRTGGGTSVEELTNIMLYDEGWSNKITFTSGYYGRAYNVNGYAELNSTYFSKAFVGYASRTSSNDISISLEPLTVGFDLVALAFSSIGNFLSFMVAPGITIGLLLMVPIIITLLLFILKLIKKG